MGTRVMSTSGVWTAVTEDFTRVNGIIAGCGQAALLTILHVSKGLPATPDELKAIIVQGINGHQAGAGGVSTPANLIWLAQQYDQPIQSIDFNSLDQYAGTEPIILGLGNASALGGSDVGVHGHYVAVLGKSGRNYVVADPNTPQSQTGDTVLYTHDQLQAAQPFWTAVVPVSTSLPATTTLSDTTNLSINPFDALKPVGDFFAGLGGLLKWVGDPVRMFKMLAGILVLTGALILAFTESVQKNPQIIGAVLSAAEAA